MLAERDQITAGRDSEVADPAPRLEEGLGFVQERALSLLREALQACEDDKARRAFWKKKVVPAPALSEWLHNGAATDTGTLSP
jgi:hypothetical protein